MKTKLLGLLLLAGGAAMAGPRVFVGVGFGAPAYYAPAPVVAYAPPPVAPVVRYVPPAPGPGYGWVGGYWYPSGPRWAWRAGYWAPRPYAGAYWVGPRWNRGRWYGGYWRR
jgi:hypothetical protein